MLHYYDNDQSIAVTLCPRVRHNKRISALASDIYIYTYCVPESDSTKGLQHYTATAKKIPFHLFLLFLLLWR